MKRSIIRECIRIAREKNNNFPAPMKKHHFSFVIQGNKIVEWGTNVSISRDVKVVGVSAPRYRGYPDYAMWHSESAAYKKAKGILNSRESFEVINIRLNMSGEMLLSKPCDCCFNFLKALNCNKIWFSTNAGFASLNMKENYFEEDQE